MAVYKKLTEKSFRDLVNVQMKKCDMFSLSVDYGNYFMSKEVSNEVKSELEALTREIAVLFWDMLTVEEKLGFMDFDEYIDCIDSEFSGLDKGEDHYTIWADFCESNPDNDVPALHGVRNTWAAYRALVANCEKLGAVREHRDLLKELKNNENSCLLENLIQTKVTFVHCSMSGGELGDSPFIVHFFKCNGHTAEWLERAKSLYDLNGLKDLAFFVDDVCVISSCSSERFVCIVRDDEIITP